MKKNLILIIDFILINFDHCGSGYCQIIKLVYGVLPDFRFKRCRIKARLKSNFFTWSKKKRTIIGHQFHICSKSCHTHAVPVQVIYFNRIIISYYGQVCVVVTVFFFFFFFFFFLFFFLILKKY